MMSSNGDGEDFMDIPEKFEVSVDIGGTTVRFAMGEIARQADGAVIVGQGDAEILVTVVSAETPREGVDFFPLTVDYRELFGAAGAIPHAYGKREGRLSEHEILTSRIIDRSIRPLFPEGYRNETQVIATLLSADKNVDSDVTALTGAMFALYMSDIPWNGPAAAARVIRRDGKFLLNPPRDLRSDAELDLVISMGPEGLVMMEGHARECSERDVLDALEHCRNHLQPLFDMMKKHRAHYGKEKRNLDAEPGEPVLLGEVRNLIGDKLSDALKGGDKKARHQRVRSLKQSLMESDDAVEETGEAHLSEAFDRLKYDTVRQMIIRDGVRLDGRKCHEIRPISGWTGRLKTPHGSALFTRGETQACVTCTLASLKDMLRTETVYGDEENPFFLHYHFPPYSVGEVRPMRGPGRREIGHGYLAWKALMQVCPSVESFPYAVRVFSEITESNGSSSMASVCGGCLALMDAGVPIRRPVAGVAMGLIMDGDTPHILTDILGDEDHLGDMDFKVAGSREGITAIQLDNKIGKLALSVMEKALDHARTARIRILDTMEEICPTVRSELKANAPRIMTIKIRPEKIGKVIGSGGRVIQEITQTSGAEIDISDDGTILIYAASEVSAQKAYSRIRELTREPEVNHYYHGKIVDVKNFGAFVEFLPDTHGMVHVSELAEGFVKDAAEVVKIGDTIPVKVLGVDLRGRIRLSRKEALNVAESDFDN